MKFKVEDLREPIQVTVTGHEDWLGFIYLSFGLKGKEGQALLTGKFTIKPGDYGVFYLTGDLLFVPKVSCGRCQDPISWEIQKSFDLRFLAPYEPSPEEMAEGHEVDLEPEDLNTYYIEDGKIDIEPVFNDIVQTALPARLLKTTADGKNCAICLVDLQDRLVHSVGDTQDSSPFAALKNLKLPEN